MTDSTSAKTRARARLSSSVCRATLSCRTFQRVWAPMIPSGTIMTPKARSSFFRNVMPWKLCAPLGKPVNARAAATARVPGGVLE